MIPIADGAWLGIGQHRVPAPIAPARAGTGSARDGGLGGLGGASAVLGPGQGRRAPWLTAQLLLPRHGGAELAEVGRDQGIVVRQAPLLAVLVGRQPQLVEMAAQGLVGAAVLEADQAVGLDRVA